MNSAIGVIGGSGLYDMEGLVNRTECRVETPFGDPSDVLIGGEMDGRQVWFLPRHGKGHRLLPTEINHRANIWALRSLGVRHLIAVTAVGSLKEELPPRTIVLPDQFFDRTTQRAQHTFFGQGIVAHVSFGQPISQALSGILEEAVKELGISAQVGGVYVNIDGPAFSTRAESEMYRHFGYDIIGMTNMAEAKLAREAEIALATIGLVTDYDCWKEEEEVDAQSVVEHMRVNSATAKKIIRAAINKIPLTADWPEHHSLDRAIMTASSDWDKTTKEALAPILKPFLSKESN